MIFHFLFLLLLIKLNTSADFGAQGIDSGSLELHFPEASPESTIRYNILFNSIPYHAVTPFGLQTTSSRYYIIKHATTSSATALHIKWTLSSQWSKIWFRWLASPGLPFVGITLQLSNLAFTQATPFSDHTQNLNNMIPQLPLSLGEFTMRLLISGFDYDNGNDVRQSMSMSVQSKTAPNNELIDFGNPLLTFSYRVTVSVDQSAVSDQITLNTLQLVVVIHSNFKTNNIEVGFGSYLIEPAGTTVPKTNSLIGFMNSVTTKTPDYLLGFSSIKLSLSGQSIRQLSYSFDIDFKFNLLDSSVVVLESSTKANIQILYYSLFLYDTSCSSTQILTPNNIATKCQPPNCQYAAPSFLIRTSSIQNLFEFGMVQSGVYRLGVQFRGRQEEMPQNQRYRLAVSQVISSSFSSLLVAKESSGTAFNAEYATVVIGNAMPLYLVIAAQCIACVGEHNVEIVRFELSKIYYVYDMKKGTCINYYACGARKEARGNIYCETCPGYQVLKDGSCQCPSGYYAESDHCNSCLMINCYTCTRERPEVCSSCPAGRTISGGKCLCNVGSFDTGSLCLSCPEYCSACNSQNSCLTCIAEVGGKATNRVIDPSRTKCVCNTRFYDIGYPVCLACSKICATCDVNTGSCLTCTDTNVKPMLPCTCSDGFFYPSTTISGLCEKCHISCLTCKGGTQYDCLSCSATRVLSVSGNCVCKTDFVDNSPMTGECKLKSACSVLTEGCYTCQGYLCTGCSTSLDFLPQPIGNICKCSDGFWYNPLALRCSACISGCSRCYQPAPCNQCYLGSLQPTAVDGVCRCPDGTYQNSTRQSCVSCSNRHCRVCEFNKCSICMLPYVLVEGICVCPAGSFAFGDQCQVCSVGCEMCDAQGCQKCPAGFLTPALTCSSTCPYGFYGIRDVCQRCALNCLRCIQNSCERCEPSFVLHLGICRASCPAGTFLKDGVCLSCEARCQTCSQTASTCTRCSDPYLVLYGNDCIKNCPIGAVNLGGSCANCHSQCKTCFPSPSTCTSCHYNLYVYRGLCFYNCPEGTLEYPAGNRCVDACQTGTYRLDVSCLPCQNNCSRCIGPTDCSSCKDNLLLLDGRCVASCPANLFVVEEPNGKECKRCEVNCIQCSSPTFCTSCSAGFSLSNGKCLRCRANTIAIGGQCVQCPANCATCYGTTAQSLKCLSCLGTAVLSNDRCFTCLYPCATCGSQPHVCMSCQVGLVLTGGSCNPICGSIELYMFNGVCRCKFNRYLSEGRCVPACPRGKGPNNVRQCVNCPENCVKCYDSNSVCQYCSIGYNLYSNSLCSNDKECAYGMTQESGICTRICSTAYVLTREGFCELDCPAGSVRNAESAGCVYSTFVQSNPCSHGLYYAFGSCHVMCPATTFTPPSGFQCQPCSYNCIECTAEKCLLCSTTHYLAITGQCLLSVICSAPQVSLGSRCVLQCPPGTYAENGYCRRICPADTALLDKWCYLSCPMGFFKNNLVCSETCPDGTVGVQGYCKTISRSGNEVGCPPGSYLQFDNCQPCLAPCATCISASVCLSCISSTPIRGRCYSSAKGGALIVTLKNSTRVQSQVELVLSLPMIPRLPSNVMSQLFSVRITPRQPQTQVFQWKYSSSPEIFMLIKFKTAPVPSTVITLILNVAAVGYDFQDAGYSDFSGAKIVIPLSSIESIAIGEMQEMAGTSATYALVDENTYLTL